MNEPKWTPGPWGFQHVTYLARLPGLESGTFEIHNNLVSEKWIAQCLTEPNANLIVAAPDLYVTLDNTPFPGEIDNPKDGTGRILLTVKAADWFQWLDWKTAALAKARGER